MRLHRNPFVVAGVFVGVFLALLEAGSTGDFVLGTAILLAVVLMSIVVVVRAFRRKDGRQSGFGQDAAMPDSIRRWVLDEPDPPSPSDSERPR